MFYIYEFIFLIFIILSPIIFLIRIISGKEDQKRFLEKLCFYSNSYRQDLCIHVAIPTRRHPKSSSWITWSPWVKSDQK